MQAIEAEQASLVHLIHDVQLRLFQRLQFRKPLTPCLKSEHVQEAVFGTRNDTVSPALLLK